MWAALFLSSMAAGWASPEGKSWLCLEGSEPYYPHCPGLGALLKNYLSAHPAGTAPFKCSGAQRKARGAQSHCEFHCGKVSWPKAILTLCSAANHREHGQQFIEDSAAPLSSPRKGHILPLCCAASDIDWLRAIHTGCRASHGHTWQVPASVGLSCLRSDKSSLWISLQCLGRKRSLRASSSWVSKPSTTPSFPLPWREIEEVERVMNWTKKTRKEWEGKWGEEQLWRSVLVPSGRQINDHILCSLIAVGALKTNVPTRITPSPLEIAFGKSLIHSFSSKRGTCSSVPRIAGTSNLFGVFTDSVTLGLKSAQKRRSALFYTSVSSLCFCRRNVWKPEISRVKLRVSHRECAFWDLKLVIFQH